MYHIQVKKEGRDGVILFTFMLFIGIALMFLGSRAFTRGDLTGTVLVVFGVVNIIYLFKIGGKIIQWT